MATVLADVQYMTANSSTENFVILVDSDTRDRSVYPTPSEYRITFETPFNFVYSLDVLDATIPRTEYTVDTNNNTIKFLIGTQAFSGTSLSQNFKTAVIDVGDYTGVTLTSALTSVMTMRPNNDATLPLQTITVANKSIPNDLETKLTFSCPYPFYIDMAGSTLDNALGMGLNSDTYPAFPQLFGSTETVTGGVPVTDVFTGAYPLNVPTLKPLTATNAVAQAFTLTKRTYLTKIQACFGTLGTTTTNAVPYAILTTLPTSFIQDGTIDVTSFDATDFSSVTTSRILNPGTYYVVFWGSGTSSTSCLGLSFDGTVTTSSFKLYNGAWTTITGVASVIVTGTINYNVIVPKGMYNLVGTPYTVLRVPEIEAHLYRSRAYESFGFGVARFKLGVVGFGSERFDYTAVPPRVITPPIGKLTCLTFRFERPDGTLYDFKGVNHSMLIVIRYYVPKRVEFDDKILNPSYDPDYIAYSRRQDEEDERNEYS